MKRLAGGVIVMFTTETDEERTQDIALMRKRLAQKLKQYLGSESMRVTAIEALTVQGRYAPTPANSGVFEALLAVIIQGRKRVMVGKDAYVYDGTHFLLTSVELPMLAQVIEANSEVPYLSLRLKLDLKIIRQLILEHELQQPDDAILGKGIEIGPTTLELLNAFERLFDLLQTPGDIPVLSDLIQREILYRLLRSEQGAVLRRIASGGSLSNRTAGAIAWLKRNYRKPLHIDDLAETVHMGVSTLHHHFRAMTSMSPLQYQKQLRLHEARRLMLIEDSDAGGAAIKVGYESATQFNREYGRLFGQPPLRDVKALRSSIQDA
jgi:AraC-like DNA-binding protein